MMINEENLVVQSNPLIESQYNLNETEQKLLRVIVSMIRSDTPTLEKKHYRFSIQDFTKFLGREEEGKIFKEMRKMAQKLMDTHVRVIKVDGNIIETSWVAAFEYPRNKGWIEFEISSKLETELLKVKEQFTQYYLANISKLKGEYTVRIYELVQQYANSSMHSRAISLEDLRKMFNLSDAYKRSFNLLQRIIRPAHKEINNKTDLSFSFRPIKESRKIVAVEFYDIQKKSNIPPSLISLIPKQYRENKDVLKNIRRYLDLKGPEYVTEKLYYVASRDSIAKYPDYLFSVLESNHGEGYIPNQDFLPGVRAAIDFVPGTVFEFGGKRYTFDGKGLRMSEHTIMPSEEMAVALKAGTLSIVSKEQLHKEQMETLREEYEKFRQQAVEDFVSHLSTQEQGGLEQKFAQEELNNEFTQRIYKESGMGSLIIKALFAEYIAKHFLLEINFKDFTKKNGVEL
jgi:hypothetical protein